MEILFLFVAFILIVIALAKIATLSQRINSLEEETGRLSILFSSQHHELERPEPATPTVGLPKKVPAAELEAASKAVQIPGPPVPASPSVPPPAAKPQKPSRTKEEWEALIGGRLLNRIGALALIIGVGFFLKYAFDNNWVTEWMRVLIGVVIGALLLVVASRFRKKGFQVFAQGLVGAGISILYLSVYAAFNFYQLVSQPVAFILMAAVTVVTFTQAFLYDSIAVSLLGWFGGFLTPFLLSTGQASEVGLFTYIALLDVGLLTVVIKKDRWVVLEPLTLAGTYAIFFIWFTSSYSPSDLAPTVTFLTIFWGIFFAVDLLHVLKASGEFRELRRAIAGLNTFVYYTTLYIIINPTYHSWMGGVTLLLAILYCATALLVQQRQGTEHMSIPQYILIAILLLVLATAIQFGGFTIAMFWSIEALILVWAGKRWNTTYVWIAGLALFGLAILRLFGTAGAFQYAPMESFTLLLSQRALTFAILAVVLWGTTFLFKRPDDKITRQIASVLHYGWCTLVFILLTVETRDYYLKLITLGTGTPKAALGYNQKMMLVAVWLVYSLPLVWFGVRKEAAPLLLSGLGVLSIAVGLGAAWGMQYVPYEEFLVFTNIRAYVLILLIIGTFVHTNWLASSRRRYHRLEAVLHFTWGLLILELLTVEANDYFRRTLLYAIGDMKESIAFAHFMSLSAIWMVYSLPMVRIGLAAKLRPTVYLGFWGLLLAFGMGAVRGIAYDPIEKFSFLLNYRTYVLLAVIAGGFVHARWLKYSGQLYGVLYEIPRVLRVALVILILVLITGETRDYFQKELISLNASPRTEGSTSAVHNLKNLEQLSLSSVWLVYSILLMGVGIWRRTRALRLISIGLFGITILKIFIYDLSFLEAVYRIYSFIGLGVILLAVSYLYQRYKSIILESTLPGDLKGKANVTP